MNKKTTELSTSFSLAIDQKRDLLMNFLVQMAMQHPDYKSKLARNNLTKTAEKMYTDMAIGGNHVEWCNVLHCKGGDCEHKEETKAALKSPAGFTTISRVLDEQDSKKGTSTFSIEFDEDLDHIFNAMTSNVLKMDGFAQFLLDKGYDKKYKAFLQEWCDKSHYAGFCKDPDCTYDYDKPHTSDDDL